MALTSTLLPTMPVSAWLSRIVERFGNAWRHAALRIDGDQLLMIATRPATPSAVAEERSVRFKELMIPQFDAAYNFARYLSHDVDAADDIVQDAFLRAYRSFDGYLGGDARAWIFAIVRNCYHAWLQERGRKRRFEEPLNPVNAGDEGMADAWQIASQDDTPEEVLIRASGACSFHYSRDAHRSARDFGTARTGTALLSPDCRRDRGADRHCHVAVGTGEAGVWQMLARREW